MKRPLLVFGRGPVLGDEDVKAELCGCSLGNEKLSNWGVDLARSVSFLYHLGLYSTIILMGGPTGGKNADGVSYAAESDLLASLLIEYGVPFEAMLLERASTNTLENLTYLDQTIGFDGEVDVIGVPQHIPRIQLQLTLLAMPYHTVFASDEVLRLAELLKGDLRSVELSQIEQRLDMNTGENPSTRFGFYADKIGENRKTYFRQMLEEDMLSRVLLEIPNYWIKFVGEIVSDRRLKESLKYVDLIFPGFLEEHRIPYVPCYTSVSEEKAYLAKVRATLSAIPRVYPDMNTYIAENQQIGWPEQTKQNLTILVEARRKVVLARKECTF